MVSDQTATLGIVLGYVLLNSSNVAYSTLYKVSHGEHLCCVDKDDDGCWYNCGGIYSPTCLRSHICSHASSRVCPFLSMTHHTSSSFSILQPSIVPHFLSPSAAFLTKSLCAR